MSDDDRIMFSIPAEVPKGPADVDDSDIGVRRENKRLRARLVELETMVKTRLGRVVPTSTTMPQDFEEKHGLKCGFHPNVIVSMKTPRVECAVCGEKLDALDVLREFARHERHFAQTLEHLRKETSELRAEVPKLKRTLSDLRSRIKRAERKQTT